MDCMRLFTKEDVLDGDEKPVSHPCTPARAQLQASQGKTLSPAAPWRPHTLPGSSRHVFQMCCRCRARKQCIKKFSIQRFPKILVLRILKIWQGRALALEGLVTRGRRGEGEQGRKVGSWGLPSVACSSAS